MKTHHLLIVLGFLMTVSFAQAQVVQENLWATNGQVFSVAKDGNTIYLGGTFTTVGPATGGGAGLDLATGTTDGSFPRVDGIVRTVISDGTGGWYIGGGFTAVGNAPRNNVAHINPDKTVDLSWNPNATGGEVMTLALSGSIVYAGGLFTSIGGQARNRIAALDATTGIATTWNPDASNVVNGIVVNGSSIFVYGGFLTIGGQSRNFIAALDASTGLATTWNPAPNSSVTALIISGTTVYVGGAFNSIGGQGRTRIAAIDVTSGLATTWNPNANSMPLGFAINGSTIYAVGGFTTIGGQSRNRIAALDATTGIATAWDPNASGSVNTIGISGGNIYVGGNFLTIGGQSRNSIAALDASTGLALSWNPDPGGSSTVSTLAISGSTIYAGGIFHTIGGQPRRNIAAINASTGVATAWNPGITGTTVRSILVNGTTVYVGGQFTNIGAQVRNNIGAIDATTGVVTSWNPDANSQIYTIALSGSNVLVGGAFTTVGGQARNRISALDATTGLATSWNPNANNLIRVITSAGSTIYAGGFFTNIGGQSRNGLAALDATTGLATAWNPNPNLLSVNDITVNGSTIYVGGAFNSIGGQTRLNIAALDAATGLATAWNPNHTPADVNTLEIVGSSIFIGGGFPIEAYDVVTGLMSGSQISPGGGILDMVVNGSGLVVGGGFSQISGKFIKGLVAVSGASGGNAPTITSFTPGSGANGMYVTITGTNFHPTLTENIVKFNGTTAVVSTSSNTSITTSVPPGASTGLITVTVNGITGASSSPFTIINTVGSYPPCLFGSRVDIPAGNRPLGAALGDLNGDGKPDLVNSNNVGNNVFIFQNTSTTGSISTGSFAAPVNLGFVTVTPVAIGIRDLDGDGKLDLVVVGNASNSVCMYRNISTGGPITAASFEPAVCLAVGQNPTWMAIGDVDGDGKPDICVSNVNSAFLSVFRNQSTAGTITAGSFAPRFDFATPTGGGTMFLADIDADGKSDLVKGAGPSSSISFFRNTSSIGIINSGTFAPRVDVPSGSANLTDFLVGDVDGDSKLDLILTHFNTNTISIRRNISSPGSITAASFEPAVFFPGKPSNQSPRLSDLDGDGKPDLLVVDGYTKTFSVFRNTSTSGVINGSSLESRADFVVGNQPIQIVTGDIDGDGAPEALVNNLDDNMFSIFRNIATSASAVTIGSFSPTSGSVGTTVVISGTNFDPVPSNNLVNFNGVYATVTASTTTSITTSVPPSATDGPIQVLANCHSASLGTFTVGSSGTITISPHPISTAVCDGVTASFVIGASGTTNLIYRWQKFNGSAYNDIVDGGGYSGTGTTTLSINTTGNFGAGDYRCKVSGDLASDAFSNPATLAINPIPPAPSSPLGGSSCGPGDVTVSVSGAVNGQYRWYTVATGGTAIAGEQNSSYTIVALSTTTTYFATINISGCESATRTAVTATINSLPTAPGATNGSNCGTGAVLIGATGGVNGQYRWYTALTGGVAIPAEINSTYTTPGISATTTYYVTINNGTCESAPRTAVVATINTIPTSPGGTPNSNCGTGTVVLGATGGINGQYRWYTALTGGSAIAGEINSSFTTPVISNTTTYFVTISNGSCESTPRTAIVATIDPLPSSPGGTPNSRCGTGTVLLGANGGVNGQYRWYTNLTGGTAISGEVNSSYTTPIISATTTYFVTINNGTCESAPRTPVVATVTTLAKPTVITSNCTTSSATLTGPSGFTTYTWSNGAATQQITVTLAGTYTLMVTDAGGCVSTASDPVIFTSAFCNLPPAISNASLTTVVGGSISLGLTALMNDPDNNLDISSLKIVQHPISGALASIGSNATLKVDYAGKNFAGTDEVTIEVCDLSGSCIQKVFSIQVAGEIVVFGGISPNGNGQNDTWIIQYIELLPETKENQVTVFNRSGDEVFVTSNYDNSTRVFKGINKNGEELPTDTYFYKIEFASGRKTQTGYLSLKR